jgi:alkaline phosphatase D
MNNSRHSDPADRSAFTSDMLETEFVCIPRPIERSERADGGPLLYRTRHRAGLWRKGEKPTLELQIVEGDPRFSV